MINTTKYYEKIRSNRWW